MTFRQGTLFPCQWRAVVPIAAADSNQKSRLVAQIRCGDVRRRWFEWAFFMGLMQFSVQPQQGWPASPEGLCAYLAGMDGRIFPTTIEFDGKTLACRRSTSESAKLHLSWPVAGFGHIMVCTGSLNERTEPYHLVLELARGELVQLRNQISVWELAGMEISDETRSLIKQSQSHFFKAAVTQTSASDSQQSAAVSLEISCRAAGMLGRSYVDQAMAGRAERYPNRPAILGCEMGLAVPRREWTSAFPHPFNSAGIELNWRHIEASEGEYAWELPDAQLAWCEEHRILPRSSPLIDLGPGGLPGWLTKWAHDIQSLTSFVTDYVQTAIGRYTGRIRTWEVVTHASTGGASGLTEEQRLTLLARVLDVARQADFESQFLLRIDAPFGEYLVKGENRLTPLQIADAISRSGVGLAGINLEIAAGYNRSSGFHRDVLDYSRLIDQWATLGVPLYVTLVFPSSAEEDEDVTSSFDVDVRQLDGEFSPDVQARWVGTYVPLFLSKPSVVGVSWAQFTDAAPHEWPHGGLCGPDQIAKPALQTLRAIRN